MEQQLQVVQPRWDERMQLGKSEFSGSGWGVQAQFCLDELEECPCRNQQLLSSRVSRWRKPHPELSCFIFLWPRSPSLSVFIFTSSTVALKEIFFFKRLNTYFSLSSPLLSAVWELSVVFAPTHAELQQVPQALNGQQLISSNGFHFVLALRHVFDAVIGST